MHYFLPTLKYGPAHVLKDLRSRSDVPFMCPELHFAALADSKSVRISDCLPQRILLLQPANTKIDKTIWNLC